MKQQATFGLLPEPEGRNRAFLVSAIINGSVIALVLLLSIVMVHRRIVQKQEVSTLILLPTNQPKPPKPVVVHRAPQIVPPTPDLLNRIAPKIVYRTRTNEPQPKMQVRMNAFHQPVLPPYRADSVALPPQPKVGLFHTNIPTVVANNQGRTSTKTGGFGDPMGVHPNPSATNTATVAAYGSFKSSIGTDSGSGSARKGSVKGVAFGSGYAHGEPGGQGRGKVTTTGFHNDMVASNGGAPQGTVKEGGFHDNSLSTNATPKLALANTQSNESEVRVIWHPRPEYTAEAKQLKIQGEVVLEVRFAANGSVHVIRVVQGLGHGLDEQAIRAAEQTKFKPAMRNGKPVDTTTYYRIDFQLA